MNFQTAWRFNRHRFPHNTAAQLARLWPHYRYGRPAPLHRGERRSHPLEQAAGAAQECNRFASISVANRRIDDWAAKSKVNLI